MFIIKTMEAEQLFSSSDSLSALHFVKQQISKSQQEGYFTASFNSSIKPQQTIFTIIKGKKYHWAQLSKGNLPLTNQGNYNFEQKFSTGKPFSLVQLNKLFNTIIKRSENTGYPFAAIHLDSVKINANQIKASINYSSGPFISFDSIQVNGQGIINKRWLSAFLGIQQGQPFDQRVINRLEDKLNTLPYLKLHNKPTVTFQNDEATVNLNINKRPANQLDAIIGFAPAGGTKLLITGKADIALYNLFKSGHQAFFNWRRIKEETQELQLEYKIPNILTTPFSMAGRADLFRQDTSFLNRNLILEIGYQIGRVNISAFSRSFKSIVIQQNEELEDISINYFGLQGRYQKLNNLLQPSKGYSINLSLATGNKEIDRGDGIIKSSMQSDISLTLNNYIPFASGYLFNGIKSHTLINDNLLYNDLLRTGGINSMRGFPESFFYVSQYHILQNEYHWLFNDGSSFFMLADGGLLKNNNNKFIYSFGLGFDLKLNNGIFELIYALGVDENPVSFDKSVLHFGYRAIF